MGDKIYYTILKTGEFRLGDLRLNIWLPVYLQNHYMQNTIRFVFHIWNNALKLFVRPLHMESSSSNLDPTLGWLDEMQTPVYQTSFLQTDDDGFGGDWFYICSETSLIWVKPCIIALYARPIRNLSHKSLDMPPLWMLNNPTETRRLPEGPLCYPKKRLLRFRHTLNATLRE